MANRGTGHTGAKKHHLRQWQLSCASHDSTQVVVGARGAVVVIRVIDQSIRVSDSSADAPVLHSARRVGYVHFMSADSLASPRKTHARTLFRGLGPAYDRAGALMSFGQDPRWRRKMVAAVDANSRTRVLDVAAGTGLVSAALRRAYDCDVVALDQSPEMLAMSRQRFRSDPRVEVVLGEAEHLPFATGEFDALTFTYLLRYVDDVPATLGELVRVVRPGGVIASLEFGVPSSPVLRAGWWGVTRAFLPVAGRLISRDWYAVGRFLGPNIADFARVWPPERLAEQWRNAGIERVQIARMSFGAGVVMWGTKASERT